MKSTLALLCLVAAAAAVPVQVKKPFGFRGNRIVGGEPARPDQFPWVVSLQLFGSHICGGFILDEVTVVTAAHCCVPLSPFLGRVIAGDYNLIDVTGDEQERSIAELVLYPEYDGDEFNFDVCVITVNTPFRLGEGAVSKPQRAVINTEPIGEAPVTIMGWGTTESIVEPSWIMRTAEVIAYPDDVCNDSWQTAFPGAPFIGDDMICAGIIPEGGKDSCSGDSGTSMVLSGTDIVIGVTSWGLSDCAEAGTPGVYAELSYFADWIFETAKIGRARHHPNLV